MCFIFLASLEISKINIPILFRRQFVEDKGAYQCYREVIPDHSHILFFSNPDGTLDFDKYMGDYYSTEYELVPRIVEAIKSGSVKMDQYQWFIGLNIPLGEIDAVVKQNHLEIIQNCDNGTVMKRVQ